MALTLGRPIQKVTISPAQLQTGGSRLGAVVITQGCGTATIGDSVHEVQTEDVVYVPPSFEHEFRNTGDAMLGVLFICVPTGEGLKRLALAQQQE